MTGVAEAAAVTILVVLVGGVIVVVIGLSAWAIWREDRRLTLTGCPPNWLSRRVRRLMGVGLRNIDTERERLIKELARR